MSEFDKELEKKSKNLLRGIDIEPPDERRMDEGFARKLRQAKFFHAVRRTGVGVGALAMLALCSYGVLQWTAPELPSLLVSGGEVLVNGKRVDADTRVRLSVTDRIQTSEGGWAIIGYQDRYKLKVESDADITVQEGRRRWSDSKTRFQLRSGEILVHIKHEPSRPYPFAVHTAQGIFAAKGTQFIVNAGLQNNATWMGVLNGAVDVRQTAQNRISSVNQVNAGFQASISTDTEDIKMRAIADDDLNVLKRRFNFVQPEQFMLIISDRPGRVYELLKPCAVYVEVDKGSSKADQLGRIMNEIHLAVKQGGPEQHTKALAKLKDLIDHSPEVDQAAAYLFIAAYHVYLNNTSEAMGVLDEGRRRFKGDSKLPLILMTKYVIHQDLLKNEAEAEKIKQDILTDYPDSPEAAALNQL